MTIVTSSARHFSSTLRAPCSSCERNLLPGLSTHLALQCDLEIPAAAFRPADPSGRLFRYQHATTPQLEYAANLIGLLMWWAQACQFSPDSTVELCWTCLRGLLPTSRRHIRIDPIVVRTSQRQLVVETEGEVPWDIDEWWHHQADFALAALLHLDRRKLLGTNITSLTNSSLRLSSTRVQPITQVSPA